MYNVTMRRVRVTTVEAVLNITNVCFYSCLSYPACAELYCRMWPAPLYHCSAHYLINGTIFRTKKVNKHKMCVLIFSTTFV